MNVILNKFISKGTSPEKGFALKVAKASALVKQPSR